MTDDKNLWHQLNRPPVPDSLENRIVANWEQQQAQIHGKHASIQILAIAAAVVLLVSGLLAVGIYRDPALVTAALADIDKDIRQQVGVAIPADTLENMRYVKLPPPSMPLKMAKRCTIEERKTIHLQVDGEKRGSVHLFIYSGDFNYSFWEARQGKAGTMYWRLIHPREGLSVLLLHTPDMNRDNVDRLVRTMFYV